jgi:hopanoid biosynthesis associated RND transporter like protein HpnN
MTREKPAHNGLLGKLWRLIAACPIAVISAGVALAAASGLYAVFSLHLNSDQNSLVSPDVPFHKRYLENLKNFGDQEYLYIVIKTGGTEEGKKRAKLFAENLAWRLGKHPEMIQAIYYRITPEEFGDGALLFASLEEAQVLTQMITLLAPYIDEWLKDGTLAGFMDMISRLLQGNAGIPLVVDPSLFRQSLDVLAEFLKNFEGTLAGKKPDLSVFDLTGSSNRYFFTANEQLLVMRVLPSKDFSTMTVIEEPLKVIRRDLEATRAQFQDVEAGLTGRPVLQADEMKTTNKDMTRASLIAVILVGLLFVAILRGWLRPALMVSTLIMAICWTFGFATLAVGELNLLSIVFALVLVGIGVDFGVHIVTRFMEGLKGGLNTKEAVHRALLHTGPGIILCAATSVCAFYAVVGSDFQGLAQLGLIGGTGILLCMVAMMTVLPALLLSVGGKDSSSAATHMAATLPFMEPLGRRPGRLLLAMGIISLVALPGVIKTHFNYNLLDLQARGLQSVEYERYLMKKSDESTWYAIFTSDDLKHTKSLIETLEKLPTVGRVESIMDFIPDGQALKSALYDKSARVLRTITANTPDPANPDPDLLISALSRLSDVLENLEEKLFTAGAGAELPLLGRCIGYVQSAQKRMQDDANKAKLLTEMQGELLRNLESSIDRLRSWLTVAWVTPRDLPASIRDIYVGKDGRFQIKAAPSGNVWDFDKLDKFVSDLRHVDPEVSGAPVGVLESARLMHRTFLFAAGLTLALVSLILWLYSRSVRYVLLVLMPLGIGILWLLELMGWLGLDFNLANFFAIPILIAIGVDGSIHLLARWKELDPDTHLFSTSTPTAVALSFATTMIGFGGLLLAHHRGLASLGAVMVLGSATTMVACLLVLPAVLKLIGRPGNEQ